MSSTARSLSDGCETSQSTFQFEESPEDDEAWGARDFYSKLVTLKSFYIELGHLFRSKRKKWRPTARRELKTHKMPADDPEYFHDVFKQEIGSTGALHSFTQLSSAPLASGMVAQVHLGVMGGKEVVIKVQHKGVEEMMISQLQTLFHFSEMLLKSSFDIGFDHHGIITDYLQQLPQEFDFCIEAKMAGKIRASLQQHQLADPSLNLIYIPQMYPNISTDKVLIQEYVNGVPILDTRELNDRFELMQACVKFFGYLILIDGRFPCDPHSGNLLARSVEGKCELVMIDFGQVREINIQARISIARIILALADHDDDRIKQELHGAGIAIDGCSRKFLATVGYILFDTRMDIMRAFHRSGLTSDQTRKYQNARVPKLPMPLYVVVRVITLLRGIVATLDLDISSAKLWKPLAKKVLRSQGIPVPPSLRRRLALHSAPATMPRGAKEAKDLVRETKLNPRRVPDFKPFEQGTESLARLRTQPARSESGSFEFPTVEESLTKKETRGVVLPVSGGSSKASFSRLPSVEESVECSASQSTRTQDTEDSRNVDETDRLIPGRPNEGHCEVSDQPAIRADENPAAISNEPESSSADQPLEGKIGSVGLMRAFWEAKSPKAPKLSSNKKTSSATPFSSNPLYNSDVHSSVHLLAPLSRNKR